MTEPVRLPKSAVFDIRSEHADADFQLWVAEPIPGLVPFPPGPRTVLWVLDANLFFGTAVEMTRLMSQLYGELPPLLVVGVAYPMQLPAVQAELRARDFTPTADAGFARMAGSLPGAPPPTLPEGRRLGRAPEFLRFLTEEAHPFLASRYEMADDSVLFGSSLGGLFALYALMERPDAFAAYAAVSPALWWDQGLLLARAAERAAAGEALDARVFLAVGGEEERADVPMLASFRMVSNLRAFADCLNGAQLPGLELELWVAEGESHTSVVPVGLLRALRALVGPAAHR